MIEHAKFEVDRPQNIQTEMCCFNHGLKFRIEVLKQCSLVFVKVNGDSEKRNLRAKDIELKVMLKDVEQEEGI